MTSYSSLNISNLEVPSGAIKDSYKSSTIEVIRNQSFTGLANTTILTKQFNVENNSADVWISICFGFDSGAAVGLASSYIILLDGSPIQSPSSPGSRTATTAGYCGISSSASHVNTQSLNIFAQSVSAGVHTLTIQFFLNTTTSVSLNSADTEASNTTCRTITSFMALEL